MGNPILTPRWSFRTQDPVVDRCLIASIDPLLRKRLATALRPLHPKQSPLEADHPAQIKHLLAEGRAQLLILDPNLRDGLGGQAGPWGLDLCADLAASDNPIPIILFSVAAPTEAMLNCVRQGQARTCWVLSNTSESDWLLSVPNLLGLKPSDKVMVGNASTMQALSAEVQLIADSGAHIWLSGETGVGKTVVARHVHALSGCEGRFEHLNCAAAPGELLASELFGHVPGAFTGVTKAHAGRFVLADKGTLFLDEITDLPLDQQAKLLVTLDTGKIRQLGAEQDTPLDVRVIAASNKPIQAEIAAGRFREDLYARLEDEVLQIPPLRERGEDVLRLAEHFIERFRQEKQIVRPIYLDEALCEQMLTYAWPRNVRQLEKLIARALRRLLPDQEVITQLAWPEADAFSATVAPVPVNKSNWLPTYQQLHAAGQTNDQIAHALGVSTRTLYRRLQDLDVAVSSC